MNIPRQRRYPMRPIRMPTRPARPPVGVWICRVFYTLWSHPRVKSCLYSLRSPALFTTPSTEVRVTRTAHVITTDDGPQEWEYQRDGRWIHFRPTYITSTTSLNVARPE